MQNCEEPFDLTDVQFIKRITIGTSDPRALREECYMEEQTALLNRCLCERPKGHIIGQEKNFSIVRMGEQQVVIQSIVYHVGFKRRPTWLDDNKAHCFN